MARLQREIQGGGSTIRYVEEQEGGEHSTVRNGKEGEKGEVQSD